MRYAILSDIHGNVEALKAVLSDIATRNIDLKICLGDIVGYYADPESCLKMIQEETAYSVAGNHDLAAINLIDDSNFTIYAFKAMEWTKKNIPAAFKQYLASLPLTLEMDGIVFTHASPCHPENFVYIFPNSEKAIRDAFSSMVRKINFIGHAHWPFIMTQDESKIIKIPEDEIFLKPQNYYLINVGSVGQPRNLDTRSSYAIYDTFEKQVQLVHVQYDFSETQKKVLSNDLPPFLAERLAKGR